MNLILNGESMSKSNFTVESNYLFYAEIKHLKLVM